MTVGYVVALDYQEDELILTYTLPDGKKETRRVTLEEISEIKELCQNLPWGRTPAIAQKIGQRLFTLLDSTSTLTKALKEADAHGEPLHLFIQYTTNFPFEFDFPFELLYHSAFLVPRKIHLVRQVSAYAHKKEPEPQNRALKILFVAC
ncbi:MAG: hypothetical protein HXS46_01620, partial [Theionarchaea archaeon]|nr:hypothetical protein [Theionarchaea archaeon]